MLKDLLNNNKIILHKKNGKTVQVPFINGLTVRFKGKNSIVEVYEPYNFGKRFIFNRSKIRIDGDNNHIVIKGTKICINSLHIYNMGSNCNLNIGENFYQSGLLTIDYTHLNDMSVSIGNDCMFGQNIRFMLSDWHKVIDKETNDVINTPKTGITIGNNVWIARDVKLLKDVTVPDNTIVATGSIVTKSFNDEYTILGGTPAKIIKRNVKWQR